MGFPVNETVDFPRYEDIGFPVFESDPARRVVAGAFKHLRLGEYGRPYAEAQIEPIGDLTLLEHRKGTDAWANLGDADDLPEEKLGLLRDIGFPPTTFHEGLNFDVRATFGSDVVVATVHVATVIRFEQHCSALTRRF